MVASFDLNRYEPPLDYVLGRIEQLVRLLDGGVDPGFVREESGSVLQELASFCKSRINFAELETKIREATSIDVAALDTALGILSNAPKDGLQATERLLTRFSSLREHIKVLHNWQHRLKLVEVGLRLELLFESVFQDAQIAIVDNWDPQPLVQLVRPKLELFSEQRRRDLTYGRWC